MYDTDVLISDRQQRARFDMVRAHYNVLIALRRVCVTGFICSEAHSADMFSVLYAASEDMQTSDVKCTGVKAFRRFDQVFV